MRKLYFEPENPVHVKLLALIPLVLSLGWLGFIKYSNMHPALGPAGELLAPPVDNGVLIAVLVLFTAGYSVFIFLMFFEDIKGFFTKRVSNQKI